MRFSLAQGIEEASFVGIARPGENIVNRAKLAVAILGISTLALASCGAEAPVEQAAEEGGIPGLIVSDGRMVLNAVEGNPAAVYFKLKYDSDHNVAIRKADVKGAESAMLHVYADNYGKTEMMESLPINLSKGTEIAFEPGGNHVMVFGLSPELKAGGTTDVTLTVSGGDSVTFPVTIVAAGDAVK